MNIIRLTTRIYPDKAGPAVYAFLLSKYVSDKNFKMFNITCQPKGINRKSEIISSSFKIEYLPIIAPRWDVKIHKQLMFLLKFGIYSIIKILNLHRKHHIDLIHCDNPAITGFIAVIFNRLFKIPFIYTHHGFDSHFKLNFIIELKLIYRYSSHEIIVSREMEQFFKSNKLDTKKLRWIPIGIDLNKFFHVTKPLEKQKIIEELNLSSKINFDDFIIIYVGYMDLKQKVMGMIDFLYGFKDFLQIFDIINKKKIKLLFLGDGKYRSLLENEISKLDIKENALLLGTTTKIEKYYAISNFGALTSYKEGFPIALLEAVASKIPCICTDVGEVKELIDDASIVPCGNRRDITAKLQMLYQNKDLCEKIRKSSYEKIKKFEWRHVSKQMKMLYKQVIFTSQKKI